MQTLFETMVAKTGCTWIKLDFNLDPKAGCNRTDHDHGEGDGLYAHYRGLYAVLDAFRTAHPEVIVEACSAGGLRIDGRVKGNVLASDDQPSTLVLSERARVEGEIRVSHAVINGTVVGPVYGTQYVELQSKCKVSGDVHYRTLEIQLGAVVQGRLVHQEEASGQSEIPLGAAATTD